MPSSRFDWLTDRWVVRCALSRLVEFGYFFGMNILNSSSRFILSHTVRCAKNFLRYRFLFLLLFLHAQWHDRVKFLCSKINLGAFVMPN